MRVKSIAKFEAQSRKEVSSEYLNFVELNKAVWAKVEGVSVLRVHSESVVACPCSGRKSSAYFDVIDLAAGDILCQLTKKEVHGWLFHRWEEKQAQYFQPDLI